MKLKLIIELFLTQRPGGKPTFSVQPDHGVNFYREQLQIQQCVWVVENTNNKRTTSLETEGTKRADGGTDASYGAMNSEPTPNWWFPNEITESSSIEQSWSSLPHRPSTGGTTTRAHVDRGAPAASD
mmetsp:Transcript_3354/g.9307  ORF Transcript_3354/g.9307 Transcript_3354/m.9307 type:complete len:127 (-) Transcript_3354:2004-2384(-)